MCVVFFCFVVVICGLVHDVDTVAKFFDLHVQCRIVLKVIFRVFVVFFALWLLYVT